VTDGTEKASRWARVRALWDREEWMHILLFLGLWMFLSTAAVYKAYSRDDWGLNTFWYDLMIMFIWSMFLMGILFVRMFWGKGIVSFRQMFRLMMRGAFGVAIIFVVIFYLVFTFADDPEMAEEDIPSPEGSELAAALVAIAFGGYLAGLLIFLMGYVMFMGLVGMVYLFTVGIAPPFLRRVRALTEGGRWYGSLIGWLFFIPDGLDTRTLNATAPEVEREFPWSRFKRAVAWQTMFAFLVVVLVSLNPLLLDSLSLETLFQIMNNSHVIVPILFLPTLIILRLGVRIDAPVKDFYIYTGIRARLLRTFLAIGTVVLFIRLALKDLDPETVIFNLMGYSILAVIIISAFTWLYFNFVENQLAFKVIERTQWLVGDVEVETDMDQGEGDDDVPEGGDGVPEGGDGVPEGKVDPVPTGT
jgi:hypothetical protein